MILNQWVSNNTDIDCFVDNSVLTFWYMYMIYSSRYHSSQENLKDIVYSLISKIFETVLKKL